MECPPRWDERSHCHIFSASSIEDHLFFTYILVRIVYQIIAFQQKSCYVRLACWRHIHGDALPDR
jgi:hypothetical protein